MDPADVGVIRALGIGDPVCQLRDHEIKIRVALTVRMGWLVDRHLVDAGRQVGAMVQVIAAQQILVRLTFAAVQGHDQPGHGFQ